MYKLYIALLCFSFLFTFLGLKYTKKAEDKITTKDIQTRSYGEYKEYDDYRNKTKYTDGFKGKYIKSESGEYVAEYVSPYTRYDESGSTHKPIMYFNEEAMRERIFNLITKNDWENKEALYETIMKEADVIFSLQVQKDGE